jgi:hypothetical protein
VTLLAALATGCGGDGDDAEPSPGTTAPPGAPSAGTSPGSSRPERGATAVPPPIPNVRSGSDRSERTGTQETGPSKGGEPSGPTGSTPAARRVERYLRENFGGGGGGDNARAGWYDHVVEVAASGETTTIRTDLSDNRAGRRLAKEICVDVRGSIPGITDTVRVTGLARPGTLATCVP